MWHRNSIWGFCLPSCRPFPSCEAHVLLLLPVNHHLVFLRYPSTERWRIGPSSVFRTTCDETAHLSQGGPNKTVILSIHLTLLRWKHSTVHYSFFHLAAINTTHVIITHCRTRRENHYRLIANADDGKRKPKTDSDEREWSWRNLLLNKCC